MTQRRILITGAGGFTGGHACQRFAEAGWEVIAVVSPGRANEPIEATAHTEICDLTDGEAVARMLRRIEPAAVLHLAGRNAVDFSWRQPATTLSINLMSTVHVLEGVRGLKEPCRVLVIGSMIKANADKLTYASHPYGFSKTLQVTAAQAWHHWYGIPVMIAEPSNLIGPGGSEGICGKLARWVVAAEEVEGKLQPFVLSSLHEARDFLDVRDAVSAYEAVINKGQPGESYALESGTLRTLAEIKREFDDASSTELPWSIRSSSQEILPSPLPRDTSMVQNLGWKPVHSFQKSINDALNYERWRRQRERGGSLST
ncbi:NAD-dependent epimerase/dehydratase family protein [Cohnella abietis]|uniref:UDP-2-acetamido-2,6-dideoxy-hexulose 4-reductase n=1 Tax=Cohnella abietis TaxID=2507935 RepID=A0A3T1DA64_9BACL|nr:NAD-dependent epimerase/dehydratase family protein [Cohnella abietis]BBI35006.1 UDP-2-acetamido-2,6-dideoxy-hexulose 4-reductase [Cohnella abietis]